MCGKTGCDVWWEIKCDGPFHWNFFRKKRTYLRGIPLFSVLPELCLHTSAMLLDQLSDGDCVNMRFVSVQMDSAPDKKMKTLDQLKFVRGVKGGTVCIMLENRAMT